MKKRQIAPKTEGLPPEFTNREDWELDHVFRNPAGYFITVKSGRWGLRQRYTFPTFPEAMAWACRLHYEAREQRRDTLLPLLYVVNANGDSFCIPYVHYPKFLKLYNELTNSKLGMPATYDPLINAHSKEVTNGRK
jgi:hypothetical protein